MKVRISTILTGFVGLVLVLSFLLFIGLLDYSLGKRVNNLLDKRFHSLLTLNSRVLNSLLERSNNLTVALSEDFMIIKAFVDLQSGFSSSDIGVLKKIFKPKSGDRSKILMGDGGEMYEFMHEAHHKQVQKYLMTSFFSDILLINKQGLVIYSYRKGDEFSSNVTSEPSTVPKEKELSKLISQVKKARDISSVVLLEGKEKNAVLSVTPIIIKSKLKGFVATETPFSVLGQKFTGSELMGETGRIILTDDDSGQVLTSNKPVPLSYSYQKSLRKKLYGGNSLEYILNNGEEYWLSSLPIKLHDTELRILVTQAKEEVIKGLWEFQFGLLITGVIIIGVVLLISAYALKRLLTPLGTVTMDIEALAGGELFSLRARNSRLYEIQSIANALIIFRDNLLAKEELELAVQASGKDEANKQRELELLLKQFRDVMSTSMDSITTKSHEMKERADRLINMATTSTTEALKAKDLSQSTNNNVQSVAQSATDLSNSIQQVSKSTRKATQIVEAANEAAESTSECVSDLTKATEEIGNVLDLIRGIAHKINLLALNATIEAVHAGEAGKSFSIVAGEVKQLSDETSVAINQIAGQIKSVTDSANYTIGLINIITHSITEVTEVANSISSSVIEQSEATSGISDRASYVANESSRVTGNVINVAKSIEETSEIASTVIAVSNEFTSLADNLSEMARFFLDDVEADLNNRRKKLVEAGGDLGKKLEDNEMELF